MAGFAPVDPHDVVATVGEVDADVDITIAAAVRSVHALHSIDPSPLDPQALAALVEGVEQVRRMVDAAATRVAGAIDGRNPFRSEGYFNTRTFLKQRCQLSGPEAYRRLQTARMRDRLLEWSDAAHSGRDGVAQSEAMARVAANPRIDPAVLARDVGSMRSLVPIDTSFQA